MKDLDLLRGLIVQSGNDAAIAIAEGIAGTEENFARMMNERAREIGLTELDLPQRHRLSATRTRR